MVTAAEAPSRAPLRWGHLVGFAAMIPPAPILKQPRIGAVAQTFLGNIQRVKWMLLAPTLVGDLTIDIQRCFDYSEFRVTGEVIDPVIQGDDHARYIEIASLAQQTFDRMMREKFPAVGTPAWEAYVMAALQRGTQPVLMLESAPAAIGLEAMLSSAITGTWTAFETMAGDLWESALNAHPDGLSELKGKRKKLLSKVGRPNATEMHAVDESDNLKTVPLKQILQHRFDLREKMGTALRGQRRFDHLAGIREAYGLRSSRNLKLSIKRLRREHRCVKCRTKRHRSQVRNRRRCL